MAKRIEPVSARTGEIADNNNNNDESAPNFILYRLLGEGQS